MKLKQINWLARRLSRVYPAEIPYRVAGAATAVLRRLGLGGADKVPRMNWDSYTESPWVAVPQETHAADVLGVADDILLDKLDVFGRPVAFVDGCPRWNVDPASGIELPMTFGPFIDFRHLAQGVDIKFLWELNRHLWLVPLAQAFVLTSEEKYLHKLDRLLHSWLDECPYPLGANWSSPVEHGIRLINWSIVWHLIGGRQSRLFAGDRGEQLLGKWLKSIYQHIHFARDNYSFFSSADNHLIGEAAGVYVGAKTWNLWPMAAPWAQEARHLLETEISKQFSEDGVNREQATCYHKFSLEFLLAAGLCGRACGDDFSAAYWRRMEMAVGFIAAIANCQWQVPGIGDADDGKVFCLDQRPGFNPYRSIVASGALLFDRSDYFGKAEVADNQTNWLIPGARERWREASGQDWRETLPRSFTQGGYVVTGSHLHSMNELRVVMDVGPLGYNRVAGHGHADALSVVLGYGGQDFLVDPGTYCYNSAPELRHYFRGTTAHNTATIDNLDQSIYGGSFLWLRDVATTVHRISDDGNRFVMEASHDGYLRLADPVRHFRRLTVDRSLLEVLVEDWLDCAKPHECCLHWHFSPECRVEKTGEGWLAQRETGSLHVHPARNLSVAEVVTGRSAPPLGWYSGRFYEYKPTSTLVFKATLAPAEVIATRFVLTPIAACATERHDS
ncbi:MAG: heparinase II/III family protein [Candidatus Nitricoxidivorans perseverans]|uniref:Heparinase II/III family protein n=1 Tax=Candidatus Nitricoxidivorans perseverans TaxID=2975601 RepID=A0AA49FLE3_9PROT|nr:MAG: heparinase II/III family protein [Candidatus Nitricoxidivorans perseverans]